MQSIPRDITLKTKTEIPAVKSVTEVQVIQKKYRQLKELDFDWMI
jgi:hypothetical protein